MADVFSVMSNLIIDFYDNKASDVRGRTLSQIQSFDHYHLEAVHDYIQWLFPLPEASAYNPDAPLLTPEDINAFHMVDRLRENQVKSFKVMLDFYGFEVNDNQMPYPSALGIAIEMPFAFQDKLPIQVFKTNHFKARSLEWITPGNHNFLRITRILRSLTLLGNRQYAESFLDSLITLKKSHLAIVSEKTFQFWQKAIDVS